MKRVAPPVVRKVYGSQTLQHQHSPVQSNIQMNAVKKINSLLQSGTVSVTGPSVQNRSYNKPNTVTGNRQSAALTSNVTITATNSHHAPTKEHVRCFVCDEIVITGSLGSNTLVADAILAPSSTKLSSKIARIVGDGFMVIIGIEDIVCRRCMQMFNQMDRLETDLERVRNNIKNLLHKKYNINDEETLFSPTPVAAVPAPIITKNEIATPPPAKLQKLNTGQVTYTTLKQNSYASPAEQTTTAPRTTVTTTHQNATTIRKLNLPLSSKDAIENQMTNMFETSNNNSSTTTTTPIVNQQPKSQVVTNTITTSASAPATNAAAVVGNKRTPIKMYKCMQCEFRTTDLSLFTPHYEKCKPRRNALPAARVQTNAVQVNQNAKVDDVQTTESNHNSFEPQKQQPQQLQTLHACTLCPYKTTDKDSYEEHVKKHMKQKPFKCRICTQRFGTRDEATVHAKTHQPDYFKCGICSAIFNRRDQLMSHLEIHDESKHNIQLQKSLVPTSQPSKNNSTQKLLQDTIDEALSGEPMVDAKSIQFHSCNKCSLTFLNEQLYMQHMKMHATSGNNTQPASVSTEATGIKVLSNQKLATNTSFKTISALATTNEEKIVNHQFKLEKQQSQDDGDLESIFEKMHSETETITTTVSNKNKQVLSKSENYTSGGITFNITIPQDGVKAENKDELAHVLENNQQAGGIDMPGLEEDDQQQQHLQQHYNREEIEAQTKQEVGEILAQHQQMQEQMQQQQQQQQISINMPSLDEENAGDSQPASNTESMPMELDELQGGDDQQIKFILNEDGQLLQLDNNHIITTDADGNQILVQGGDSDQIQQLLQSVVMQGEDGEGMSEGQTLQMITGENGNQMILVQGEGQEPQLIDASCLNAEGTHITTEDGTQIPVSMSYGQQPGDSGSLTILNEDGTQGQIQFQIQSQDENGQTTAILADGQQILLQTSDLQHQMEHQQHDDGSMHQQILEQDDELQEHQQQHMENEEMEEEEELATSITIDEQQHENIKQENNDELFDFEDLIQGNSITKTKKK